MSKQVTLTHRDGWKRLAVYTYGSDFFWSGIVSQVPFDDVKLRHAKIRHDPLAFLSVRFKKQQIRWSTLEKEAYVVLATLERIHWILETTS